MPLQLRIADLSYSYGASRALDGVCLSCDGERLVGVMGPNGSGKSTLFKILATVLPLQSGIVEMNGLSFVTDVRAIREQIGVAFQTGGSDKKLTVRENLRHHGHLYGLHGAALAERMHEILRDLDVGDRQHARMETLSGGVQRRVDLAKSLLHRPGLLLLDEPTAGLDPKARREFWALLKQIRSSHSTTVLFTTHLVDEAADSDKLVVLHEGRLVACDTPAALQARLPREVISIRSTNPSALAEIMATKLGLRADLGADSLRVPTDDSAAIFSRIQQACDGMIDSITATKSNLEDVFFALTGKEFRQ